MRKIQRYGWQPDLPDHRDFTYSVAHPLPIPPLIDLRPRMPEVYDQGQLGSCTANAIGAAIQYQRTRQGFADFIPSRLFVYFNERRMEGTIQSDAGAQIRDGIKSIATLGVCPEDLWPYDTEMYGLEPKTECYTEALKYTAKDYWRLPRSLTQMKGCLTAGFPFVFGFSVYDSFESVEVAQSGIVPMPASGENMIGGHAVLAVGFDDSKHAFLVRNSWGTGWGIDGYFYLPYLYLTDPDLSDDMWCVKVESA